MKRLHEEKITFSLAYRTQFFHTPCTKLDLVHACLFERAQSGALRTECEKIILFHLYNKLIATLPLTGKIRDVR